MRNDVITGKGRVRYLLIFIIIYFVWSMLFTFIGNWASDQRLYSLSTALDEIIPLVVDFEYIYVLGYLIPFVPLFVIKNISKMNILIVSFIILNLFAFTCFISFPVYCPRPSFEIDSLSAYLLSLEYLYDKPVNNFPSLHAGIAWLLYLSCRGYHKPVNAAMFLIAIGIGISAVFIKQHFMADIFAGYILTHVIYIITHSLMAHKSYNIFKVVKSEDG
jgi:membrane-associated phospholipid phosphatase